MSSKKNILAIHTGQDKDVLQHLLLHLRPLEKDFNIDIWSDYAINHGERWKPRNVSRLDHADIFLLLLGNSFTHSGFIEQYEFKRVIDRFKDGMAIVVPILLDDCPRDVDFTFDDYNFNFGELQVFQKDERPMGDWDPMDKVFTQVSYYVRGLLTSSAKVNTFKEPANKGDEEIPNIEEEGQIAIDFFDEREVNDKAVRAIKRRKEAEAEKRVEENKKPGEEAEAKEVIRKEKRLRQKAESQKRIDKEVEAKRLVQEEMRPNEVRKVPVEVGGGKNDERKKSEIGSKQDKRPSEIVAVQERAAKKNRLSRYNHQFEIAKVVEAKRADQEERSGSEELKAKMAVANIKRGEITKSLRGTGREQRPGEIAQEQKRVTRKNRLAEYNYQFETAEVVKAKTAVREESWGNEVLAAIMVARGKIRVETAKALRNTEGEKRLGEIIVTLKKVMQNSLLTIQSYQVKTATVINPFFKAAKKNISTNKKRIVRPDILVAALVVFGILIYVFTGDSGKQSTSLSENEKEEVDSNAGVNNTTNQENQAAAILKLAIGDVYRGGIIFSVDPSGETGKIAHIDDRGPMIWNDAMKIHEQLGEAWRLPNMGELRLMYENIGQGADNKGEFADEMYWSATPYDDFQARLLRFSDGNASYHYNSAGTHRKFLVRAIQDFKR